MADTSHETQGSNATPRLRHRRRVVVQAADGAGVDRCAPGSAWFWWFGKPWAGWAFKYPSAWKWSIGKEITAAMEWLMNEATFGLFTFRKLTRAISAVIEFPTTSSSACSRPAFCRARGPGRPDCPAAELDCGAGDRRCGRPLRQGLETGALLGGCFLYLVVFGQWDSAMVTCRRSPSPCRSGSWRLLIGMLGYRSWFERAITPVLD